VIAKRYNHVNYLVTLGTGAKRLRRARITAVTNQTTLNLQIGHNQTVSGATKYVSGDQSAKWRGTE
jgi:hypothetical protein